MTIFNLGSINVDHLYSVARLPRPGETVSSHDYIINMGGKGLNITVAVLRSGADIKHIGAIGSGDHAVESMLSGLGLGLDLITRVEGSTGHAVVYVDDSSENCIVIHGGANQAIPENHVRAALADAGPGDWLVLQNETNANSFGIEAARERGMKIALVAAPFDAEALASQIDAADLVTMNESETALFEAFAGRSVRDMAGTDFLLTYGSDGASFHSDGSEMHVDAFKVDAVDTTGAGDTFFGAFMAGYATGVPADVAMTRASAAAALMVQRKGAASVAPHLNEIEAFLSSHSAI